MTPAIHWPIFNSLIKSLTQQIYPTHPRAYRFGVQVLAEFESLYCIVICGLEELAFWIWLLSFWKFWIISSELGVVDNSSFIKYLEENLFERIFLYNVP